jgi:hypothetical protein
MIFSGSAGAAAILPDIVRRGVQGSVCALIMYLCFVLVGGGSRGSCVTRRFPLRPDAGISGFFSVIL